jgi:hypothetical protein
VRRGKRMDKKINACFQFRLSGSSHYHEGTICIGSKCRAIQDNTIQYVEVIVCGAIQDNI